jgi:hypothetical protein
MSGEIAHTAIPQILQPMQAPIDAIGVPLQQAEAIPAHLRKVVPRHAFEFLVCAWHHAHLSSASPAQHKRSHQQERGAWRAFAAGLRDEQFDALTTWVFAQRDSLGRASSLVEMVNAFIRPSLHSCQGQMTHESLHLMMLYHHHRRYKSGKRQGQAPIALVTGTP